MKATYDSDDTVDQSCHMVKQELKMLLKKLES